MSDTEPTQVPGIYRRRIGDITVTALSDGEVPAAVPALERIDQDDAQQIMADNFALTDAKTQINCFVVQTGEHVALIDTGGGVQHMAPSVGRLMSALDAAGIAAADVDCVLLTHIHPDHSYGLVDGQNRALFPKATVMMAREEHDFWLAGDSDAHIPDRAKKYFTPAREAIAPYQDRIELFSGEGELLPGLRSMPLPGHTPGHSGYRIDSGEDNLLIWGDIVHVPEVQLKRPEVGILFDIDGEAAAATRKRLLDQLVADPMLVAGMHVGFPGFLHVTRDGEGYGMVAEKWRNTP